MGIETRENKNKNRAVIFLKGVAERSMDLLGVMKAQSEIINKRHDPYEITQRNLKKLGGILEDTQEAKNIDSIVSCLHRVEEGYTYEIDESNNTLMSSRSVIEKKNEKLKYLTAMKDRVLSLIEHADNLASPENIDDEEALFQELKDFYTKNSEFYKELSVTGDN